MAEAISVLAKTIICRGVLVLEGNHPEWDVGGSPRENGHGLRHWRRSGFIRK